MMDISARTFTAGSTPGDEGRDPTLEPAMLEVSMSAFSIDASPYPNDPSQPVRTFVTRADADRMCKERGERLCTELEWELACKGSEDRFATAALHEWTASAVAPDRPEGSVFPAVRGPTRCAQRSRVNEARASRDLGFRCCKGEPNVAAIGAIAAKPPFLPTELTAAELAHIFAKLPELARIGQDIRFFDEDDVANVVSRGAGKTQLTFATTPLIWSPEPGAELLVATGRAKGLTFVVALYPLQSGDYRLASSFLFLNESAPVALAYEPHQRQDLYWSSCWGCAGEQGSVKVREDHKVVIVQH
jgi:hypothetical protein